MASETVTIYCKDQQTPTPDLVDGVLIRVFNAAGDTFITQDYTGNVIPGAVEFTLDGDDPPNTYTIRMSKVGVAFDGSIGDESKSPQSIDIYSPPAASPTGTNDFDVYGETFTRPTATNPRLCRCSGYFFKPNGGAYEDMEIEIHNQLNPTIVDGNAIMQEIHNLSVVSADSSGYVEIDLYRNGVYRVFLRGLESCTRTIYVPDASSVNIVNLVFPYVSDVIYAPTSVSIAVDATEDVTPTVYVSDGRTLTGTANEDVEYTIADESVATVAVGDVLTITGVSSGSTTLSASRIDESTVVIPDGITQTPLSITVT
jgi:hypothetical protein